MTATSADRAASRDSIKTAVGKEARPRGSVFGWSDVLRAMPRENVRQRVLESYRAQGFTPDDFARRTGARAAMADALTRAEDWLELDHPRLAAERAALAAVRRPLEEAIR